MIRKPFKVVLIPTDGPPRSEEIGGGMWDAVRKLTELAQAERDITHVTIPLPKSVDPNGVLALVHNDDAGCEERLPPNQKAIHVLWTLRPELPGAEIVFGNAFLAYGDNTGEEATPPQPVIDYLNSVLGWRLDLTE